MAATLNGRWPKVLALLGAWLLMLAAGAPAGRAADPAADPTRPPQSLLDKANSLATPASTGAPAADPDSIVLQAILHAEGRPARVMVDGWLYRLGDVVHGCRLSAITPRGIECDHQGRRRRIAFTPLASTALARKPLAESAAPVAPVAPLTPRTSQRRPPKEPQ